MSERPGQGLTGSVSGRSVQVTSRKKFLAAHPEEEGKLPAASEGLECVVLIDGGYAAALQFRDQPRSDGAPMAIASMGLLPPAAGAILQELIDVAAVVNALRAALPPRSLTDY